MPAPRQTLHELRHGDQRPGRRGPDRRRRQDQDDQGRVTVRGTLAFVGAFTAYWLVALPLDTVSSPEQQLFLLSTSAWLFLGVALALQPPAIRGQVLVLVCVATVMEFIGSILWGAYRYRLDNLPLFGPPGPRPFYLPALPAASLPLLPPPAPPVLTRVSALPTAR